MRTLVILATLISSLANASTPTEVMIPVNHVFTPSGFDSNDNTEIIVQGHLPNLCHKSPKTEVTIQDNTINITLTSLKYDDSNPFCPPMIVPIVETVDLGLLNQGDFKIVVNKKSIYEQKAGISIAKAPSNAIDNSVYLGVEFVERNSSSRTITLRGHNPSTCYVFDKFEIFDNGADTLSILPKMKQVSEDCPLKMTPFEIEMDVPKILDRGMILLHVRSMSGKSVNTLFQNL